MLLGYQNWGCALIRACALIRMNTYMEFVIVILLAFIMFILNNNSIIILRLSETSPDECESD